MYTDVDFLEDDSEVYEKMQEHLLWGGMCLAYLQGSICAIIDHGEYYAFVDSGTRSASGLAAGIGSPVAVFNTCLNDLMLHIRNLKKSLNVNWIGIGYMSVKEMADGASKEVAEEQGGRVPVESCNLESAQVTAETSGCQKVGKTVRGSFHQGDDRFHYMGLQCMAIGLVSLARHTVHSMFSWQTEDLDQALVLGDKLYTGLRVNEMIGASSEMLCVPELPEQTVIGGQSFSFEYGDFASGDINMVDGDHIEKGTVSLANGLEKIFMQYSSCLLTMCGTTCAIVLENGQYALVDSHARSVNGMVDGNGTSVVVYFDSLGDVFNHNHVPVSAHVDLLGVPCKNESIVADGNCFFRAISQSVSGAQKYHRKIRLAVVKHLESNAVKYENILRSEYCSMADYISKSKMRNMHSWATEVEIQATADCLGVNVFTFYDGRWLKYSCNSKLLSQHGIYLENCSGNHYETVVCVHGPELQSCYGNCEIGTPYVKGYSTRFHHKDQLVQHQSEVKSIANDACCAAAKLLDTDVEVVDSSVVELVEDCDDHVVDDSLFEVVDHLDVEILADTSKNTFQFSPLSNIVAQTLCSQFNLEFERQNVQVHTKYGCLGSVCVKPKKY
ncbi:hypothetical protein F2P81_002635 [Scophthalmus maximus]|uniref:ubiquitinyl hydrolase 1 n=1 Tax=Scophthalmus maximus TaxID=52904 RepID=A0A6A4TEX0_SCOMX|nr:hypothetical protein F2P81_002635 [Scophthalmus maximus]